ncbi:MAG: hypothetical protein AAFP84_14210 [Actinomycetota bacterium]
MTHFSTLVTSATIGSAPPALLHAAEATADDGPSAIAVAAGIGILVIVLVVGLQAIRRQRREGRRSKLPPIG